jgi:DNA-binding beta-propeller fold protein YncE
MIGARNFHSIIRHYRIFTISIASLLSCALPSWVEAATLFVSDGDVIHAYDAGTGAPTIVDIFLQMVTGIAIGPHGDLFAASSNVAQIYRYDSTSGLQIGSGPFVPYTGQNDGHDTPGPGGMAFAPNGNLHIADVTLSNVHEYDTAGNSVTSLTSPELAQPTDVAFDSNGNLYVADTDFATVLKSIGGTQPFTELFPPETGGLTIPTALTFGPDGKLYVLDSSNSGGPAIRRYTAAGVDDGTFISYATIDFQPNDIAFGPDGKFYVSGLNLDTAAGQILRYLSNGTADGALVSSGPNYPTFMAFSVPEPASLALLAMVSPVLIVAGHRFLR